MMTTTHLKGVTISPDTVTADMAYNAPSKNFVWNIGSTFTTSWTWRAGDGTTPPVTQSMDTFFKWVTEYNGTAVVKTPSQLVYPKLYRENDFT